MITPAVARAALGLGADTTHDREIVRMIDAATATLGRELNRYLGPPRQTIDIRCGGNPPGTDVVYLAETPITEYPVVVATRGSVFEAYADLADTEYALEGQTLYARSSFPSGRGSVKVTYTHGYPVGTGPAELMDLVLAMVVARWKAGRSNTDPSMQSESLGDYSYTRGDLDALTGWAGARDRWRRRNV